MTRIISGTAAVVSGDRTVTFTGPPLSDANCPEDGSVALGGLVYFIASRTDTMVFELTRDYEGSTGTVSCEIDPLNPKAISLVNIARAITDYNSRVALLDADGKGLFFVPIGVTGANDPGPGKIARNAAAWADTTAVYMDVLDGRGRTVAGLIDLAGPSTVMTVLSLATGGYVSFMLVSAPSNEGPNQWRKIVGLTLINSDGAIADGEDVAVRFDRAGSAGPMIGIPLVFDGSGVTDIDPGAGKVRGNHLTNPTMLWISKTDAGGGSIVGRLNTLDDSTNPGIKAVLRFQPSDGGNTFMDYNVTGAVVDATNYVKVPVALISGAVASDGQALTLGATPMPNKGTDGTGTGDFVGPAASVDGALLAFNGLTGKLGKVADPASSRAYLGVGVLAGFRNKLINGDFTVFQRGTSGSAAAGSGVFLSDRWFVSNTTNQTVTVSQQLHTPGQTGVPGNPKYKLRLTFAAAPTTGTVIVFQGIEGAQTLAGSPFTMTGYFAGPSGTEALAAAVVQYFGSGGSPSASVGVTTTLDIATIYSALTQRRTAKGTLPSIAGMTLGSNGNDYLQVGWTLTPRQAGNYELSHMSFVEGDASGEVDPFAPRHPQQELALCQWYYEVTPGLLISVTGAGGISIVDRFATPKRVAPTVTYVGGSSSTTVGASNRYGAQLDRPFSALFLGVTANSEFY